MKRINAYNVFLMLGGAIFFLALLPYYFDGCLILGGEADFVLDFTTHLKNSCFAWYSTFGAGVINMSPHAFALNIVILSLIEKFTGSVVAANFTMIFSIYFLPFIAMFMLSRLLKARPFVAFMVSFFYVVNPFILYHLICINQNNVFSIGVMPLFLWLILKYYNDNFRLCFFFGFISACFSFSFSNPPLFAIIFFSVLLSVVLGSFYHNKKIILIQIVKKLVILLVSFFVFNSWWIMTLYLNLKSVGKSIYPLSIAKDLLNTVVTDFYPIIAKMFSLTLLISDDSSYDFFAYWYNTVFAGIITLVPMFVIIFYFLFIYDRKKRNLLPMGTLGILLIVLFFVKGNAAPFGGIYNFLFIHVPYFKIFKTPVEKFGILYVFILSILLLFIMNNIKERRHYKFISFIFALYLLFCSVPLLTGNIIPEYKIKNFGYGSRKYKDKTEYKQFREFVNSKNFEQRILSLPGTANYQVCLSNYNNKKYTGLDPVLKNTNKPFIGTHHYFNLLYKGIGLSNYKKVLGIYNVGQVVVNEDLIAWYGFLEKETIEEKKIIFTGFMQPYSLGSITVYENEDDFLPRIYVSSN
ncbi:MAG: hypothetical protein ABIG64_05745 [Candidatus Omnitrophota bacterium]